MLDFLKKLFGVYTPSKVEVETPYKVEKPVEVVAEAPKVEAPVIEQPKVEATGEKTEAPAKKPAKAKKPAAPKVAAAPAAKSTKPAARTAKPKAKP